MVLMSPNRGTTRLICESDTAPQHRMSNNKNGNVMSCSVVKILLKHVEPYTDTQFMHNTVFICIHI